MVIRMKQVQVLDRKRVFDGFLKVDEATVSYEKLDGSMSKPVKRQSLERGDSVAVLLLDRSTQELILVRQFRYPMLRHGEPWLLEMVAGMIDESETPEIAARREVFEEVRAEPLDLQPICASNKSAHQRRLAWTTRAGRCTGVRTILFSHRASRIGF